MKKQKHLLGAFVLTIALSTVIVACNEGTDKKEAEKTEETTVTESTKTPTSAKAMLSGTVADTALTGTVEFKQHDGKVKMHLEIASEKMANKSVAVHIHDMADCGDMGMGAHGHWNPTSKEHGKWGSASFHLGDIGNLLLDAKGNGVMDIETDLWTVGGDVKTNVINHSIIVHSGKDDYTTQPTGGAGSRIGCGVINAQ